MSDRPIQKGDLVMVVRSTPCCGSLVGLGDTFEVNHISTVVSGCSECNHNGASVVAFGCSYVGGTRISRLIRIDPPPVAEDVPAEKELYV